MIPPFPHTHAYLAFSSERRAKLLLPFGGIVLIAEWVILKKNTLVNVLCPFST